MRLSLYPGNTKSILHRNTSCGCAFCFNGDYKNCECLEQCREYPKNIIITTHHFTVSAKKKKDANDENDDMIDLDKDEANKWEEMHIGTEALKYIEEDDFSVIKTDDEHAYYLLKLTSSLYDVAERNYLEVYKEISDGNLYHSDTFCVAGNCPTPPTMTVKKRDKDVDMFIDDHYMHQALSSYSK